MFLTTHIPSAPLNQYIELLVYYTGYNPDYPTTRMLPEGTVELLLPLDDLPRVFYKRPDLKDAASYRSAIISGMQHEFLYTQADKGCSMLAVKFKPGGSYPFLHLPLRHLNDLFVEADLILGQTIVSLREELLEMTDSETMFWRLEKFLMDRLEYSPGQPQVINGAISLINRSGPSPTLKSLAADLGYSQKQLIHIFKKHIGLTPKYYQRIARFNKALRQLEGQPTVDWSQISYDRGFYDQAHFINEFKFFSGFTPEEYRGRQDMYPNFVPMYTPPEK